MFELLFKYPASVYQQGTLQLEYSWLAYALVAAAAGVLAAALAGYLRAMPLRFTERSLLAGLRVAWVALLVFALCQPVLVVTLPQTLQGDVVILLDDSQSMRISDTSDGSRGATLNRLFAPDKGAVSRELAKRFPVHHVAFGLDARRMGTEAVLSFASARSDIANALNHVRTRLQDATPGALVLVGDGGDQGTRLQSELLALRAAGVPVHTVGIGSARFERDLELTSVSVPPRLFPGDMLHAEVTFRQQGTAGQEVMLQIAEQGVVLHRQSFTVPAPRSFTVPVVVGPITDPGIRRLTFAVTALDDETIVANNRHEALLQVVPDPVQVLHFEGEPRFEVKFVRRALSDDDSLDVISLIRTAENKYYRVGVTSAEQLADGFPDTADALFGFDVLLLGSVEASLLSGAQQQLLKDFVARRGGALLLLGARRAFAEGGYSASQLSGLLPVRLRNKQSGFRKSVSVSPTSNGLLNPVVQALMRAAPDDTLDQLPPLTMVNPLYAVKPGATVLLQGNDGGPEPFVVLAYQRYGRSTVAVLSARDTWRWQMHDSIASDDLTHETLWRELLRWLARPVPRRIELAVDPRQAVPGEQVQVTARPVDAAFQPLSGAALQVTVTTPRGQQHTVQLNQQAGETAYTAKFNVLEQGLYELEAALQDQQVAVTGAAAVEVLASGEEFRGAELDEALLRRIAETTGGRYFAASDAAGLSSAIEALRGDTSSERRLPLYDAPVLFLLLVLLTCGEWLYRRRRGLA